MNVGAFLGRNAGIQGYSLAGEGAAEQDGNEKTETEERAPSSVGPRIKGTPATRRPIFLRPLAPEGLPLPPDLQADGLSLDSRQRQQSATEKDKGQRSTPAWQGSQNREGGEQGGQRKQKDFVKPSLLLGLENIPRRA